MKPAVARTAAFGALLAVERGAWSAEALASKSVHLDSRDAGLASDIVFGTLRHQGEIDALVDKYSKRPAAKLDEAVRLALRIALYQIRFLNRVPDHAAVNDSVELARRAGPGLLEHELVHRREHSAEFQAVWLAWAGKKLGKSFHILPLLAAHVEAGDAGPSGATAGVLEILEELLKSYAGRVCLLSGADFAHVGPRFGDEKPAADLIPWMQEEDAKSLAFVCAGDAEGFHRSVAYDGNKRKVCGLGSVFSFLWLLKRLSPGARGRLLQYGHAPDPSGGEVSFASVAFPEA